MFQAGDRVERTEGTRQGERATVAKYNDEGSLCVHWDDPDLEMRQHFEGGWYPSYFKLIEDDTSNIPEDWS